jgi:hypothetical protein
MCHLHYMRIELSWTWQLSRHSDRIIKVIRFYLHSQVLD